MPTPTDTRPTPDLRGALAALIVGGIAAILDSTMVALAIHTLSLELGATSADIQWVSTSYLLAIAVAIPVTGWVEGRWGGKRAWAAALLVFVTGSVLCAIAWSVPSLIAFRAVQGLGGGLIMPLMQTLAVRAAGGRVTSRMMATVALPMALGPILGPVIGGVILSWLSWRWLFLVNVPLVAVGLWMAWRYLPDDRRAGAARPGRLDVAGLVLLAAGLAASLLGLTRLAADGGIGHVDVLVPAGAGAVLLGVFVARALHPGATEPVVDIRLLRVRSLGSASLVLFGTGAAMYAAMFLLPLFYQQLHGQDVLHAGLPMIPQGVGALAARFAVGRLVDRFGARAVTVASFVLTAVATVPFALAGPGTSLWWLGAVLLVRGIGIGAVLIPAMSVAYQDVPHDDVPHATANTRIAQQVGGAFGTAIVAVALQSLLDQGATAAFHGAFWWAIGLACLAVLPALALPGIPTRREDERPDQPAATAPDAVARTGSGSARA